MTEISEDDVGFQFPCDYMIKAMGLANVDLDITVVEIVRKHCNRIYEEDIKLRESRNGKYVSVNLRIVAHSKQQLDDIYDELTAHEHVLMRL